MICLHQHQPGTRPPRASKTCRPNSQDCTNATASSMTITMRSLDLFCLWTISLFGGVMIVGHIKMQYRVSGTDQSANLTTRKTCGFWIPGTTKTVFVLSLRSFELVTDRCIPVRLTNLKQRNCGIEEKIGIRRTRMRQSLFQNLIRQRFGDDVLLSTTQNYRAKSPGGGI